MRSVAQKAGYVPHLIGMPRRPISDEERLVGHLVEVIGISETARRLARPLSSIACVAKRVGVQSPFKRGRPAKARA